jgi:hypothetical protein
VEVKLHLFLTAVLEAHKKKKALTCYETSWIEHCGKRKQHKVLTSISVAILIHHIHHFSLSHGSTGEKLLLSEYYTAAAVTILA